MTADDITDLRLVHKAYLEQQLSAVESYKPHVPLLKNQWSGMVWPASKEANMFPDTGVAEDVLAKVGKASVTIPTHQGFVCYSEFLEVVHSLCCCRRSTHV